MNKTALKGLCLLPPVAVIIAAVIFIVQLRFPERSKEPEENRFRTLAFGTVAISCLALSMFTGYITRPVSIDAISSVPIK